MYYMKKTESVNEWWNEYGHQLDDKPSLRIQIDRVEDEIRDMEETRKLWNFLRLKEPLGKLREDLNFAYFLSYEMEKRLNHL